MFAGTDTTPWELLGDGKLVGVTGSRMTVHIPHIAALLGGDDLVLRLAAATHVGYLPFTDRLDEPEIEDVDQIAALGLGLDDVGERNGAIVLWAPGGRLELAYESLTVEVAGKSISADELRAAIHRYWSEWRARTTVEPVLVQAALREPWTPALIGTLCAAWRKERTSELAEVIEIVDLATRGVAKPFVGPESVAAWVACFGDNPSAAIATLAKRARDTHILQLQEEIGSTDYDTYAAAAGRIFAGLTRCLATIDTDPDPRIGRGLEGMLAGPSNYYFRVDQVAHVVATFDAPNNDPSFADYLLPLLSKHADAGSAARLDEESRIQYIECDCNGAEMGGALRVLAAEVRLRYPQDRKLAPEIRQALRERTFGRPPSA